MVGSRRAWQDRVSVLSVGKQVALQVMQTMLRMETLTMHLHLYSSLVLKVARKPVAPERQQRWQGQETGRQAVQMYHSLALLLAQPKGHHFLLKVAQK